ncbi:MAG: hypothetical protein ACXWWD_13250 [Chitinophagaceae bacterium]
MTNRMISYAHRACKYIHLMKFAGSLPVISLAVVLELFAESTHKKKLAPEINNDDAGIVQNYEDELNEIKKAIFTKKV